jgi:hypothetical protein
MEQLFVNSIEEGKQNLGIHKKAKAFGYKGSDKSLWDRF